MRDGIKDKYTQYIIQPWSVEYIHNSVFKDYVKDLIEWWYDILGYDWIIYNQKWTLSPLDLVFDFSRKKDLNMVQKNELALKWVDNLIKTAQEKQYVISDLYIDVVYR